MQNFRTNQTEVTISMQVGECVFRNYVDETGNICMNKQDAIRGKGKFLLLFSGISTVNTHVPVPATEFEAYRLAEECDITFCQKDFRVSLLRLFIFIGF